MSVSNSDTVRAFFWQFCIRCSELCAGCGVQLDLAFVLDLSGSVEEAYGLVLELARQTISGLNVDRSSGTRVAVITFSDQATVKFYLDEYASTSEVLNALVFRRASKRNVNHLYNVV